MLIAYQAVKLHIAKNKSFVLKFNWYLQKDYSSGGSRISRRGGVDLVRGAVDPRGGYISKILHVKTKESGPIGGGARRARPPRSANVQGSILK